MNIKKEIVDAIQVMVDAAIKKTCPVITFGVVTNVGQKNHCTVQINNVEYNVKYHGETPPNIKSKYPVFIPSNNMSMAFIMNGGLGGTDWGSIYNKPTTIDGYGITDAPIIIQFSLLNGTITTDKTPSELYSMFTSGGYILAKIYDETNNTYLYLSDAYVDDSQIIFAENIYNFHVIGNIEQEEWSYEIS